MQWYINLFFNLQPYRYYESWWLTMDGYDEYNNHAKQFKGIFCISLDSYWLWLYFLQQWISLKLFITFRVELHLYNKINQIVDPIYFPLRLILDKTIMNLSYHLQISLVDCLKYIIYVYYYRDNKMYISFEISLDNQVWHGNTPDFRQ